MNEAHWHLVVNHLPIIFPLVGVIVIMTGFISKSEAVKRTAFMIFILGAFASIAAMSTGEGAEEIAEKITGITENDIERHEEAAETFAMLSYILGGLSILGLWAGFKQKTFSNIVTIAVFILASVLLFFAKHTGTTGGEIRHTEIRNGHPDHANENSKSDNEHDD